jgi:hypothetical protein
MNKRERMGQVFARVFMDAHEYHQSVKGMTEEKGHSLI